jgi:hypothetical protein
LIKVNQIGTLSETFAAMEIAKKADTKGVIRIRKSKKDRQHNDQKDNQRSTKHTHTTKDRAT